GRAAVVARGAGGLRGGRCSTGSRAHPECRGTWSGASPENFTPGHLGRALLEGMARAFHDGSRSIAARVARPFARLVGAGNGLRENPVLAQVVGDAFGLPLAFARHREEAAYGAGLLAAGGAGGCDGRATAGRPVP